MMRWTRYVQKDILAMKTNAFEFRIRLKKEWLMPRQEGRTVRIIPNIKRGFERAQ